MLESLNYSFRNPKNIIWVIYRIKQLRIYKKNHVVLRGPQLGKQRWRARLGILRVNVQRSADEQHYCLQIYVIFQYTASEILANWSFLFSRNMWKEPDMLVSGITNASIFELLYFGNLSISLASSRLLPYSSPLSHSLPLSTGKLESNLQVLSGAFYFIKSRRKWVAKIMGHSSATLK